MRAGRDRCSQLLGLGFDIPVPDISPNIDQRLAGVDVDELDVGDERHAINTILVCNQVGADIFSEDIEGPNLSLGVQNRAGGAVEDVGIIVQGGCGVKGALVVCIKNRGGVPFDEAACQRSCRGVVSDLLSSVRGIWTPSTYHRPEPA